MSLRLRKQQTEPLSSAHATYSLTGVSCFISFLSELLFLSHAPCFISHLFSPVPISPCYIFMPFFGCYFFLICNSFLLSRSLRLLPLPVITLLSQHSSLSPVQPLCHISPWRCLLVPFFLPVHAYHFNRPRIAMPRSAHIKEGVNLKISQHKITFKLITEQHKSRRTSL